MAFTAHCICSIAGQSEDGQAAIMINMDFMGGDIVHYAAGTSYFRDAHKWISHRSETSALNYFVYRFYYKIIVNANMILDNIDAIEAAETDKNDVKGQAMALRGWSQHQLVQLFGIGYDANTKPNNQPGVPIVIKNTTDPLPRATVEDVYKQINADLDEAITLLSAASAH